MVTEVTAVSVSTGSVTSLGTTLVWPAVIAGNKAKIVVTYVGPGTVVMGVPTGFTFLEERTGFASDYQQVFEKTCTGAETGSITLGWSVASKITATLVVIPNTVDFGDRVWGDSPSLTVADTAVPAVTVPTGSARFVTVACLRGSTPPTAVTVPAGTTLAASSFGIGGGANCQAAAYTTALESDGSVGAGIWTWGNAASAGRSAITWSLLDRSLTRFTKTLPVSWGTRARFGKNIAASWNVANLSGTTRFIKSFAVSYNARTMLSEASFPVYAGHRGGNPGPEETLFSYNALYAKNPVFWLEGDMQLLSDGVTVALNHDDDIARMSSASSPYTVGNVVDFSPAAWATIKSHVNAGFTGADQFVSTIDDIKAAFAPGGGRYPCMIWENKAGTPIAVVLSALQSLKGQVVVNGYDLLDVRAAVTAGFDACYQTETPDCAAIAGYGIKYLSISMAAFTGAIGAAAHSNGLKVFVYTVNSAANRDSMAALGADAFFSNSPQTLYAMTRFTKTLAVSWSLKQRLYKTLSTSWGVASQSRFIKVLAASWNTRSRYTKTLASTWNARTRFNKTLAFVWNVNYTSGGSTSNMTVWNGTAEIPVSLSYWNGTTEIPATVSLL